MDAVSHLSRYQQVEHLALKVDDKRFAECPVPSFSAVASDAATGAALTSFFLTSPLDLEAWHRRSTGADADRNRRTTVQLSVHRIGRGQRRLVCHGASQRARDVGHRHDQRHTERSRHVPACS